MKHMLMLAGAAAFAFAAPAVAKAGKAHGQGNAHSHALQGPIGYGAGGCPPGLAKKTPACVPPGQAKRQFNVGQRLPHGYNGLMGYNQVPYSLRNYYGAQLDPYSRYAYDQNYLYRVDPRTMMVQQILNALVRPY